MVVVVLTRKRQDFVPNVDCGIMLATVQRVLPPGAQEPFHIDRLDASRNGFKKTINIEIPFNPEMSTQAMQVGNFRMSGSLSYFEPNSGPCVLVMPPAQKVN